MKLAAGGPEEKNEREKAPSLGAERPMARGPRRKKRGQRRRERRELGVNQKRKMLLKGGLRCKEKQGIRYLPRKWGGRDHQ